MKLAAIALTTFKEGMRQPVLYVLIVASLLLILIVGQLPMFTFSVLDDLKMVKDMAVSTSVLMGLLVAIFLAIEVITEEIENWTVLTVLSKPVHRWEFIVGKFAGLVLLMAAVYLVVTIAFIFVTWFAIYCQLVDSSNVYPEYLRAFWAKFAWPAADELWRGFAMSFLHTVVLTAVAVAVCARLPMILSVVVYFGVFVAGHLANGLAGMAEQGGWFVRTLVHLFSLVLPNLETFNVAHDVGLGHRIAMVDMGWSLAYAACYSAAAVLVGVLLFRRREVY